MVTCLAGMTACGEEAAAESSLQYTEADIADAPESLVEFVNQVVSMGQQAQAVEAYPDLADAISGWASAAEEIGTYGGVTNKVIEMGSDEATVTLSVDGDPYDAEVIIVYGTRGEVTSFTVNVIKPFGELMKNAGLNTLLGMGTVFIVLILISLLISCFKYISVFEKKQADKKAAKSKAGTAPAPAAPAPVVETVEEDDCELVAVIAAAIAASEGAAGADGFVVRSIKRRTGKWQKA